MGTAVTAKDAARDGARVARLATTWLLRILAAWLLVLAATCVAGNNGLGWIDNSRLPALSHTHDALFSPTYTVEAPPTIAQATREAMDRAAGGGIESRSGGSDVLPADYGGPVTVGVQLIPNLWQRWAYVASRCLPLLLASVCLWLLSGVTRLADPFVPSVARRLSSLAWCALLLGAAWSWGREFVDAWLLRSSDVVVKPLWPWPWRVWPVWLAGPATLWVVARAWHRGVEHRAATDGLV